MSISSIMKGKGFNKSKQSKMSNFSTIPKGCNLYHNNCIFVSPINTIFLAGNIIVYTPIKGTNGKKYFNHIIYKGKLPNLARNKYLSFDFSFQKPRLFHLSTEKSTDLIRQKWTSKWLFPSRHKK